MVSHPGHGRRGGGTSADECVRDKRADLRAKDPHPDQGRGRRGDEGGGGVNSPIHRLITWLLFAEVPVCFWRLTSHVLTSSVTVPIGLALIAFTRCSIPG